MLELLKLLNEGTSDFKIGSSWVQKFQSLKHWPTILSHEISSQNWWTSALASYRMNENTLIFFDCVFDEIINCLCCSVFSIKNNLVFEIKPLKRKINNSTTFPVIWNLFSCTIDNMCYFVGNNEFLVLYLIKINLRFEK